MGTFALPERRSPAPEFPPGEWLNSAGLRITALRGQVTLIYFWDYALLPALQLLEQVRKLEQRYLHFHLQFVGVHTPIFSFGRERQQVTLAVQEQGITHPTLLDNEYRAARLYQIPAVPCVYLINAQGMIEHVAREDIGALERALQRVLRTQDPTAALPQLPPAPPMLPPLKPLNDSRAQGSSTLELFTGLQRGVLGNPEGYSSQVPILYRLPDRRRPGRFYVEGAWRAGDEHFAYEGRSEGIIHIPYEAREVYAVFSPHHDLIERLLKPETVSVEIWQDDRPLTDEQRGEDLTADGRALVDRPRVYHLVRNARRERHELTLRVRAPGFSAYVFSLCGAPVQEVS